MVKTQLVWISAWLALVCACNVESTGTSTGGVDDPKDGECPAGVTVVLSDYVSAQIALSTLDGATRSASFLSTGSTVTDGSAFPLSGDVVLPGTPPASNRIVLLDRFGTNVVTWAGPATAEVLGQLPVGTGFESNPQDYLEIDQTHALITRWGQNQDPGREPFDDGGDVLVIDTRDPSIENSIVFPATDDLPARPSSLAAVGGDVLVTLDRVSLDFTETGWAMLVGLDVEQGRVAWEFRLGGLKSCGRPTLSPDGRRLALACTGAIMPTGEIEDIGQSAIVLFDPEHMPPVELERFKAEDLAGEPVQDDVAFASNGTLLFKTQTAWSGSRNNRWMALDLETGTSEELLQAQPDRNGAGKGLVFAGMECTPGCSTVCLLADSDRAVLERVDVDDGGRLQLLDPIVVEGQVGLPPVGLALR